MKISIDLDIEASEIPLATELLNTLRSLTEHIRVRQKQEHASIPNESAYHDEVYSGPPNGVANSGLPPQPAPAPAAAPDEAREPEHVQRQHALANYIRSAVNNYEAVAVNLGNALASADPEVEKLFIGAFSDVVLDPKYLENMSEEMQAEHHLYMNLLGELSKSIKERISQKLVSALVKDMMGKRSGPRNALMLPAMVYAHLVHLDIVNIRGTLKMVEKFLSNPGSEAVGLTMLGKTSEICIDKVLQHASPAHLTSLTKALDRLDQDYAYDVDYLNGIIKWRTPCFRVLTSRQKVHEQAVSALAYDPVGKHLISASKDGVVIVWDEWANPVQKHQLPNCYAIAMAIAGEQRDVVIAGQPIPGQKVPACIAAISLDQPHQLKGPWLRQRTTIMSSIIVLPTQMQFAVGETQTKPGESSAFHSTVIYDCASLQQPASAELQPAATLSSPSAVMCLTGYGHSKQVVLAGTRTGQVALWAISNPDEPVKNFAMPEHAGSVFCLESDGGDIILAGTSTNLIIMWSMKTMAAIAKVDHLPFVRTMSLDNYPVLKIQCWPNKEHIGQAAVITTHGCWNVNFSSPEPEVQHVQDVDNDDCSFQAAAWAGEYPYLYTGGVSQKVYVCQLVPGRKEQNV